MQFLRFAPLAILAASISSVSAGRSGSMIARRGDAPTGNCSHGGTAKCCDSLVHDAATKKAFAAFSGLDSIEGLLGVQCIDVPVMAGGVTNQCKSTPVCCDSVENNGLIALGCTPATIN